MGLDLNSLLYYPTELKIGSSRSGPSGTLTHGWPSESLGGPGRRSKMETNEPIEGASAAPVTPVFASVEEAMKVVGEVYKQTPNFDIERYKQACEYLVDQRANLVAPVYIVVPLPLFGVVGHPAWMKVMDGSEARCGCGDERKIQPSGRRKEYEASSQGEVLLHQGEKVFLKSVGADQICAFNALQVIGDELGVWEEPLAPTKHLFSHEAPDGAYDLKELLALLADPSGEPVIFKYGEAQLPLFQIKAFDLQNHTLTVVLDKDVEFFSPSPDLVAAKARESYEADANAKDEEVEEASETGEELATEEEAEGSPEEE